MNFLADMEQVEDILKSKYNQPNISLTDKRLIEKLFVFAKERQCITSAALQVEDAFLAVKEEKVELLQRDKELLQSVSNWVSTVESDNFEDQKNIFLEFYGELTNLCKRFHKLVKKARNYKNRVKLELESLNQKLDGFNDKLKSIGEPQTVLPFKLPKLQMKRLTRSTESAFNQIDILNKLIRRLRDKLDVVEDILNDPEKFLLEMETSMADAESSETSNGSWETVSS